MLRSHRFKNCPWTPNLLKICHRFDDLNLVDLWGPTCLTYSLLNLPKGQGQFAFKSRAPTIDFWLKWLKFWLFNPNFDINVDQNLTFLNVNSDWVQNSNIIIFRTLNIDYLKVTLVINLESKSKNLTFLVKCRPFSDQFCQKVRISDHFRKSRP